MAVVRKSPIQKISDRLYDQISRRKGGRTDSEIEEMLSDLYPGESMKKRYREYQSRKYTAMLTVIAAGAAAAVCMHQSSRMHTRLEEGTCLSRNEWGEGNYTVTLLAETKAGNREYVYEVRERILTIQEIELLGEQIRKELPGLILGENESLQAVREDLNLASRFDNYPFAVMWRSGDYERIQADGRVKNEGVPENGKEVVLTAVLSYEGSRWEQEIKAVVVPKLMNEEEKYRSIFENILKENDKSYETSSVIRLPDEIGGEAVSWKEKREDGSILIVFCGIIGAAFTAFGMKQKLREKSRLRKEELAGLYPDFVSRLQLYLGAGLTVKNAFLKIGGDYRRERSRKGQKLFLYEEILISGYQLLNGVPEDTVYREWGKRCGEMRCRKLGFLLAAHLRQGNDKILALLSEETDLALEERRRYARKQGEEAGTKLLFPMLMMLIVVMFLILLPALNGFGTI